VCERLIGVEWEPVASIEELLGSVRAIGMTPSERHGYDPIPLIRAGDKTHTLRGNARVLGTVNQVSVNGTRIPLWIRWVARERVRFGDVCCDEFAIADGIRPVQGSASAAMVRLFESFHGRKPDPDQQMWLLHFEVFCDLMEELEGTWEM